MKLKNPCRIRKNDLVEFISILPQFEKALLDPLVVNHVLAHLRKLLVNGNAERFYTVCSAYTVQGINLIERIFPFLKGVPEKYIIDVMRLTDEDYRKHRENPSFFRPRLENVVAKLLANSVLRKPADARLKLVDDIIKQYPLFDMLFADRRKKDFYYLIQAICQMVNRAGVLKMSLSSQGSESEERKAEIPQPRDAKLILRAHEKATKFVCSLVQSGTVDSKVLLPIIKQVSKQLQKVAAASRQQKTVQKAKDAGSNVLVMHDDFDQIEKKFKQSIWSLACDYTEEAFAKFAEVSELIIKYISNHPKLDAAKQDSIEFFDNVSSLAIALKGREFKCQVQHDDELVAK
jgi:hypothetical protein